jgi:hypothetical protein
MKLLNAFRKHQTYTFYFDTTVDQNWFSEDENLLAVYLLLIFRIGLSEYFPLNMQTTMTVIGTDRCKVYWHPCQEL